MQQAMWNTEGVTNCTAKVLPCTEQNSNIIKAKI